MFPLDEVLELLLDETTPLDDTFPLDDDDTVPLEEEVLET